MSLSANTNTPQASSPLPSIARLARPYIWNELPGWSKVYDAFCTAGESYAWPVKTIRGKWHGKLIELHLADPLERMTYFLGRYYDLPTQLFLRKYLKRGDNFVDIGANIGMISLLASYLVGEQGTVRSFEPNPVCGDRIETLVRINGLRNLTLTRKAIADAAGRLELHVPEHAGMGTLAEIPADLLGSYSNHYAVEVAVGDKELAGDLPIQIMKIDVEGYECKVLAGCAETIGRWKPCIVTEVVPEHLKRAGSSAETMFDLMHGYGYRGVGLSMKRSFGRYELALEPLRDQDLGECEDVLWLHPGSAMAARVGLSL
jgi:FkbM family methyltransferase